MTIDTASMQLFGTPAGPESAARGLTSAGLVLLYAPCFEQMRPAYLFTAPTLVVGREAAADVVIPEPSVSRRHARISYRGDAWWVEDLDSHNGTLVDGAFVAEAELEHLCEVRIGDAIFKFVAAGAESYIAYRLDGVMVAGATRRSTRLPGLVGGYQMDRIASDLERVARADLSVLVLGESGTGKEVVAHELHRASGRTGALQAINCAAIPANLLESELFGYKRGAFSGADRDKLGLVRAADGGTLFLDEIGDMPTEAQVKLLRVLETREVFPVGATTGERVDVRLVSATNRDLARAQHEGRFRGDLLARLQDYRVALPPLRERKEDLYLLARHLLARHGHPDVVLSFAFLTGLLHYDFPFNIRELESALKRGVALARGPELGATDLPDAIRDLMSRYGQRGVTSPVVTMPGEAPVAAPPPPVVRVRPPDEAELRRLLGQHAGNVAAVGRLFGKERMQVHRWMKRWGIDPDEYR